MNGLRFFSRRDFFRESEAPKIKAPATGGPAAKNVKR